MVEFLKLPENQRRQIIEQVNARTAMSIKAVEKDWWVSLMEADRTVLGGH